ncbi:MAG: XRE family transcriptional regulator [Ignavibacteriae bacterium 37-53-5]|nr:MAG: XRE family transcriptional regulator [Ignavibacteriae bacterium 37-53-5]
MVTLARKLMIEQLDKKLEKFAELKKIQVPSGGWINAIRTALNMSLAQLGRRLKMTSVGAKGIEDRERDGGITLKKLIEVGRALDLDFVYGFVPRESSIDKMIEKRAEQVAREIVMRTSHNMKLEDQENSEERLEQAIKDRAETLKREVPKHLWD